MKLKKRWITDLLLAGIAIAIALLVIHSEISTYGKETALPIHFISDGFFVSAVFYLGFGILTFISEAGNFYGIQYLGYTLVQLFSLKKSKDDKKDYFTYCIEKRERQRTNRERSVKWSLIVIGLICLAVSVVSAALYYRMFPAMIVML